MKNNFIQVWTVLVSLLISSSLFSQLSGYKFYSSSGSFTANSGSATAVNSIEADDALSKGIAIGFSFKFDTINYTHFKASSNGWITFDTTLNPSAFLNRNNGLKLNSGVRSVVAPLWDNLDGTGGAGSYELTGTSPSRILTFEWKNWKWDVNATSAVMSFQVKLYETSNKIEYVYKQETGALVSNSSGASIGLGGKTTGNGNFLSLNSSGTSPTVSTTVETSTIASKPATGQIYLFDKSGCSATKATLPSLSNLCVNGNSLTLLGVGVPSGGTSVYSGTGVSGNQFNPSSAGVGTHTISYKYTDAKSCVDSVSTSITVDSVPIVAISSLPTLCKGDPSITLTQGSPIGGIYSGNNVSLGKYNPSVAGGDSLQYLFTDAKGCKDSLKSFIKVDSVPIISFPTLSNRCLNAGSFTLNTATPTGGVYSGTNVSGGIYTPTIVRTDTIQYFLALSGACKDSVTQTITIDSVPTVSFASISPVCFGAANFTLTGGSPSGGAYSGNNVSSGSYSPRTAGTDTITYSFTDGNSCSATAKSFVVVNSLPTVTFSTLTAVCEGAPAFALSGGAPIGGSYSGNNVSSGSYNPVSAGKDTLKYVYTNSNSCTDSTTSVITVNAKPKVVFPTLSNRCLNAGLLTLNTATPSGGTYSGSNVSRGVYTATLVGLDTIKYSFTNSSLCTDSATQTITIDSVPKVSFATLSSVCKGSGSIILAGGSPSGGTYSGNKVSGGSYITSSTGKDTLKYTFSDGNSCTDSAFSVIQVDTTPKVTLGSFGAICKKAKALTLSSGVPLGGTYFGNNVALNLFIPSTSGVDTIHYTFKDANNCSDTATQSIVVDTLPAVTLASIPNICLNTPSFALSGGSPSGGSYSGKNVISNRYNAANVGLDTIKYSFTDSNTCNAEATGIIQIDSIPIVKLNLGFTQACENSPKIPLSGGAPLGGTYKGSFVSGTDFDPSLNTPTTSMVYYLYIDSNKCSDSANSQVIVDTIQKVTLASFGAICKLAVPQVLTSGSPSGGVYFGINVNGSSSEFDPSTASLGNSSISYTFTTPKGCEDSAIGNILVEANPTFNLGNDTSICGKDELTLDIGIPFLNYNWSTGDTSRSIKIQKSAIVIVEVTDTSTMANCTYSDTIRVDYDEICVGLNELFANGSIKYFPNPSNGKFYIEFESIELDNMQIQIISMKGEEVFKKEIILNNGIYKGIVEMDNIPSGIYLMNLISDKGFITKRISIR